MSENNITQEEVITLKLAKNMEAKKGKVITIGTISKILGGLDEESFSQMREFGIKVAQQIGIEESTDIVKLTFEDKDFQEELGLKSKFCNEYWYIRREYEVAKYFHDHKEDKEALMEIMKESLIIGIKDSFNEKKIYKFNETMLKDMEEYIVDFEELKELGL